MSAKSDHDKILQIALLYDHMGLAVSRWAERL